MKYVDEFRDPATSLRLLDDIKAAVSRPWTVMEVCGGQTHGLLRYGIPEALRGAVDLIHGPGCPVCVTPEAVIDDAIRLSFRDNTVLASFGDMLRVPGSVESLQTARSRGGRVVTVSSPLDAVRLAANDRNQTVVFLAVGFETTAPATALAALQARGAGLSNFLLLTAHVRVQPAMELLLQQDGCRVQGFLAAGHVCAVTGIRSYRALVRQHRVPVVVTGFEPIDLLTGIRNCVQQLEAGTAEVQNCYRRAVAEDGNPDAVRIIEDVYDVVDSDWRGLGRVPGGGLRLAEPFRVFDARERLGADDGQSATCRDAPSLSDSCRAGDVLTGRLRPCDCPEFGQRCTPDTPLGAPMVSAEGACAAWYRYAGGHAELSGAAETGRRP